MAAPPTLNLENLDFSSLDESALPPRRPKARG